MTLTIQFRKGLGLAALIILIDQASKWWILSTVMNPPRVIEVTTFFNLVMAWNQGVSFGMLNSGGWLAAWGLPIATAAIILGLGVWLARADKLVTALGLGLIIGGALGNLIDRLRFGAVADFLDFHWAGYHWPAFNAADSAIFIGAVALVLETLFESREKQ